MNRWMAGADAQPVNSKIIEAQPARPVLLVGSVPLGSVAEVFEVVGANLGDLIRRVPDGEVGPRLEWIAWQKQTMGRAINSASELLGVFPTNFDALTPPFSHTQKSTARDLGSTLVLPVGTVSGIRRNHIQPGSECEFVRY